MAGHTVLINSFLSTTDTSSACINAVYPRVVDSLCVLVQLPNMARVCCVRIKLCHHIATLKGNYLCVFICSLLCTAPVFVLSLKKCPFVKAAHVQKRQFILLASAAHWGSNVVSSVFHVEECSSSPQPCNGRDAPWWGHARRTHAPGLFPGQFRTQSGINF